MKDLRHYIEEARANKVAVGHFNISNIEALWAIFRAAQKLDVPVIIGTSEGERNFVGVKQAVALVKSLREEFNYPIFLNADHSYSFEKVKEAIDAGYDAVIYDGTELSYDENLAETKKCVEYARNSGRDIIVEGELGFIGKSSKVLDKIPEGAQITDEHLTKPEEARNYVEEAGLDLLAPAVGNIHGMLKGGKNPALNIERVGQIYEAAGVPLVLHGGSGNSDEDFVKAIDAGVGIVHINTEIRVAYKSALQKSLADDPEQVAPYKILKASVQAMEKVVEDRLRLFNKIK